MVVAAVLWPWLAGGTPAAVPVLRRGVMALASLALACVGITAASRSAVVAPLADASLAWIGVCAGLALVSAAPSIARGLRRVRSPAFQATAARLADLPRWYVVPAALVGGVAADMGARAGALAAAEARSGAAWGAGASAMLVHVAVHVPRWDAAATLAAALSAVTLAGVLAWHGRLPVEG